MSVSVLQQWEVRPTNGADTNGGGFVQGSSGTDWSQQNAAQYALTGMSATSSGPNITTSSASNDMVGNIIQITGGTNFTTGFYQIISVNVNLSITVDRTVVTGTATGGTGNIGGALKTLSKLLAAQSGGLAWIKAESTITSAANISVNYTANAPTGWIGYTSTRGDNGLVTIQAITNTGFNLVSIDNNNSLNEFVIKNIKFDCNSLSNVVGLTMNDNWSCADNCTVINVNGGKGYEMWNGKGTGVMRRCYVNGQSGGTGFDVSSISNEGSCTFIDCGVYSSSGTNPTPWVIVCGTFIRCWSANNTGSSPTVVHGFKISANPLTICFEGCIAYKNGGDGWNFQNPVGGNSGMTLLNCVSYGNGGYGFDNTQTTTIMAYSMIIDYLFSGGNTSGDFNEMAQPPNFASLTADPFVAGTSNNFAPNSTSGGGAVLRAAGYPGILPVGGTGYRDAGMLQHQDSGGGNVDVINQVITNYYGA